MFVVCSSLSQVVCFFQLYLSPPSPPTPPHYTTMAGAPPGGGAPFDLSALSSVLNDPAIKNMAEQIAADPAFAQMTSALQDSLLGGGAAAAVGGGGAVGGGAGAPPALDPAKYAEAMQSVMQNGQFLQMAETLGKQIMEVSECVLCVRERGWARVWRGGGGQHAWLGGQAGASAWPPRASRGSVAATLAACAHAL